VDRSALAAASHVYQCQMKYTALINGKRVEADVTVSQQRQQEGTRYRYWSPMLWIGDQLLMIAEAYRTQAEADAAGRNYLARLGFAPPPQNEPTDA